MKISCLIAAYKAGNYIGKALESIRAQLHTNWEIVVVEDGSRDQTERVVREFGASVSQPVYYENLGTNRGVATARNRLLELADGEAVSFLDADDWWDPRHLTSAHAALETGGDLIVARIQIVDLATGAHLESYAPEPALFDRPVQRLFERSEIMTSSCVTLRRDLTRRAGGFDPCLRIGEDRDYWLRCAAAGGRLADSGHTTCFYAKHAGSTMAKTLLWAEQEVAFYRKHRRLSAVPARVRRCRYADALTNYGRLSRVHTPGASARALFKAWCLRPHSARTAAQWLLSTWKSMVGK